MGKTPEMLNMMSKGVGLDFCGLWRQGKDETHEFLMQVVMWRIGCSVETWEGARQDKLWLRAEIIKYTEGALYPRVFEIVLPKKGFGFVADTFYNNTCIYGEQKHFFVEFSGNIYGPSPLTRWNNEGRDVLTMSTPGTKENWVEKEWIETMNTQHLKANVLTLDEQCDLHGLPKLDKDGMDKFTGGRAVKQKSITACEKEQEGVK